MIRSRGDGQVMLPGDVVAVDKSVIHLTLGPGLAPAVAGEGAPSKLLPMCFRKTRHRAHHHLPWLCARGSHANLASPRVHLRTR